MNQEKQKNQRFTVVTTKRGCPDVIVHRGRDRDSCLKIAQSYATGGAKVALCLPRPTRTPRLHERSPGIRAKRFDCFVQVAYCRYAIEFLDPHVALRAPCIARGIPLHQSASNKLKN